MVKLRQCPVVHTVEAHMCAFGMRARDRHGEGFAMKPTRFLTNSIEKAKALNKKCPGGHRHVHLMEGRARAAAIYPKHLCRTVCRATLSQARVDASDLFCMECVRCGGDDTAA